MKHPLLFQYSILNGSKSTCIRVLRKIYMVHNTCPFNSLTKMISMTYLEFSHYRNFVNSSCKLKVHGKYLEVYIYI